MEDFRRLERIVRPFERHDTLGAMRQRAETFMHDLSAAWAKDGKTALDKMAVTEPSRFVQVCASLIPKDVSVSLSARLPGSLEPDDWQLATQVLEAVRQAIPDAGRRPPGDVLAFVLEAIRAHGAKQIEASEMG